MYYVFVWVRECILVFLDEYIYSTLVKVSDAYKVTLGNDYFIIKKKKFTAIDNSRK